MTSSLRTRLWLIGVAGLVLGGADFVLILTSDHAEMRGLNAALGCLAAVSFIGTGIFAWARRPQNRVGALMVATGFAWGVTGWTLSDVPLLFSLGMAVSPLYIVFVAHLISAFPSGRTGSRFGRGLLVAGYADVLGIYLLWWLLDGDPGDDMPSNVLALVHAPGVADVFGVASTGIGAVILAILFVRLARQRRHATPLARHAMAPVIWTGLVVLAGVSVTLALEATSASDLAAGITGAIGSLAFVVLPFAYLVALLRTRYARAGAVRALSGALTASRDAGALRDTLAEALGDPSLRLVYWTGRWVDRDGHPVELPASGVTEVRRDGGRIGALVHDPQLDDDPDLVGAVAAAAALALENERLEAELRARVAELQASRAKLIEVSMAERRSLERDLHDGAQQRLVALALQVGLARRKLRTDPDTAEELLTRAGAELGLALEELRELARGIHPAILTDRGLPAALQALADRAPLDVELGDAPAERLPAPVEAAAYFVVAESLTNVAKYARARHATVSVQRDNGRAIVEVRDDGVGGANPESGTGLRGLAERLTIIDGRLEIVSPPGSGTVVRAEIPCG